MQIIILKNCFRPNVSIIEYLVSSVELIILVWRGERRVTDHRKNGQLLGSDASKLWFFLIFWFFFEFFEFWNLFCFQKKIFIKFGYFAEIRPKYYNNLFGQTLLQVFDPYFRSVLFWILNIITIFSIISIFDTNFNIWPTFQFLIKISFLT